MKTCSCGAEIEFVKVGSKTIPCDPAAPVYMVSLESASDGGLVGDRAPSEPGWVPGGCYWVSHFKTCPHASEFSAQKGKRAQQWVDLLNAVNLLAADFDRYPDDLDNTIEALIEAAKPLQPAS